MSARLPKKLRERLRQLLNRAQFTREYLHRDDVAVAKKRQGNATTTLHYSRADGWTLYEVAKYPGELTGLEDVAHGLQALLDEDAKARVRAVPSA